nr:PREDICTED: suppressor of cytokine signaling 2 [Tribolium castaneum]XP_972490.2 PREDICTED: suppressor of cytokine signaling 2 [Tribolium castaneum]|eukprot:XP_008196669.1 PREDICTED: suppressor of cytokine signaling 2 [Tribolium castaneum]
MPAMLGCSTVCPNCKHQFTCCAPVPPCCSLRRSVHVLSGGGIVPPLSPCPSPQVSPSVPLTFVLPPLGGLPAPPPEAKPETEFARLQDIVKALRLSGWYYEGLTFDRSDELLKDTRVGTFLVRNSSDPRFLFSLSVQTDRGPKSVRLFYTNGHFRLDAQPHLQASMPLFPGVIELVQHYVRRRKDTQVWVDPQGKCLSSIYLDRPLRREPAPPSLKHLARLAIHRQLRDASEVRIFKLGLPTSLAVFLAEYPYAL